MKKIKTWHATHLVGPLETYEICVIDLFWEDKPAQSDLRIIPTNTLDESFRVF